MKIMRRSAYSSIFNNIVWMLFGKKLNGKLIYDMVTVSGFPLWKSYPKELIYKLRNKRTIMVLLMSVCILGELVLLLTNITNISWASHDYPIDAKECVLKYMYL